MSSDFFPKVAKFRSKRLISYKDTSPSALVRSTSPSVQFLPALVCVQSRVRKPIVLSPSQADKGTAAKHRIVWSRRDFPCAVSAKQTRSFALPPAPLYTGRFFVRACLLAALLSRAFPPTCERDARTPSQRNVGNAGVPPAMPTAREKTYPFEEGLGGWRISSPCRS